MRRLGEAFAAKLDLRALTDVVLHGSIDALDADAGHLTLQRPDRPPIATPPDASSSRCFSARARGAVRPRSPPSSSGRRVGARDPVPAGHRRGRRARVARADRDFSEDERELLVSLVERAESAAAEIVGHELLREQANTDPLTRLGNRRKLAEELRERLAGASRQNATVLMLFDLDGFKSYNDTFGHIAGDALLARLGGKLEAAVAPRGAAFRLGGDEFCVLLSLSSGVTCLKLLSDRSSTRCA